MCSKMSSANRDMDREVTKPRFQGNIDTNIGKELNRKNMSTNPCRTVQSRAQ